MSRYPTTVYEDSAREMGHSLIAGVDEVGRGPLAGPVVAAAVILPRELDGPWIAEVRDSKQLSARQRRLLSAYIVDSAISVGLGAISNVVIDRVGIVRATRMAMEQAIEFLDPQAEYAFVDGRDCVPQTIPCTTVIKGDELSLSIACASIVAKVARDNLMCLLDQRFPGWKFAAHKGYATGLHLRQLELLGPSPLHRMSYSPFALRLGI